VTGHPRSRGLGPESSVFPLFEPQFRKESRLEEMRALEAGLTAGF